tara:strand:- start:5741 stop:6463 length:723 start_codon:yes stop_codon:yes gene_type:complete
MRKQLFYRELAKYYDLIYSKKDYKKESDKIKKLILKYKKSKGRELLDVACGTGRHLKYLKGNFSCIGVDINEEMLNIAKKTVKDITFKKANMITLNLNKKFDVITCLFSSIGYVKTYSNLKKTFKNFARHLKIGGVVIISPWLTKSDCNVGFVDLCIYDDKNLKIARLSFPKIKGNISIFEMQYLVAEKNKGIKHFVDKHELGLFEVNKTLEIMKKAGFKSKYLKNGTKNKRGTYLGIKE